MTKFHKISMRESWIITWKVVHKFTKVRKCSITLITQREKTEAQNLFKPLHSLDKRYSVRTRT